MEKIILVSTPWPLFSRPSIQLGALKAWIRRRFPDLDVRAYHFYLEVAAAVGYPVYSAVGERSWPAEAVYAALLYPGKRREIEGLFHRESARIPLLRDLDFAALTKKVERATRKAVESVDWNAFGLAGFSICLCQLTSALYFLRAVRRRAPGLPIVVGGSIIAGNTAGDLLEVFPEIDFAVNGEGERPLERLVESLCASTGKRGAVPPPGVITGNGAVGEASGGHQIADLDTLPLPDYGEYFRLLGSLGDGQGFFPTLPLELSRGCRWKDPSAASKASRGCAFCNLNLQWEGYRAKSARRAVSEIDRMTSRYRTLSVAFMDNLLPTGDDGQCFTAIAGLGKDLKLFGEIRATTSPQALAAMRAAGMAEVQIGIEALSSSLLVKLNKGTTAMRNIAAMRACEELNLANASNLILHFPGSDAEDVAETLANLAFVQVFRPLRCVHFWLGAGSPVWQDPGRYGIRAVCGHPHYSRLFPPPVARGVRFMIQAYRGDLARQRKLWQPVKAAVRRWQKSYAALHSEPHAGPILSYRDGREFMIIRQRRPLADALTHRLTGTSRAIYLHCRKPRSLKSIVDKFPGFGEERVLPFLRTMVAKKLMFEEKGRFLSLAINMVNMGSGHNNSLNFK